MLGMLLDTLFPPQSLTGIPGKILTEKERLAMRPAPVCMTTVQLRAAGAQHLDRLAAGCMLDASPLVRTALHRFKYRRVRALGGVLAEHLITAEKLLGVTDAVLCPVPLHWSRLFMRGFNQSADLAHHLSRSTGQPVRPLLRRRVPTGTQTKRTREERLRVMRGVFVVREEQLPPHVVLVDDVATTCATLDACACALKRAGVARVEAVAVALG